MLTRASSFAPQHVTDRRSHLRKHVKLAPHTRARVWKRAVGSTQHWHGTALGMPRRLPLIDSSALLAHPERLRAQAAETGYLYLPGILPVDEVNALRSELLGVAAAPRCVRVRRFKIACRSLYWRW